MSMSRKRSNCFSPTAQLFNPMRVVLGEILSYSHGLDPCGATGLCSRGVSLWWRSTETWALGSMPALPGDTAIQDWDTQRIKPSEGTCAVEEARECSPIQQSASSPGCLSRFPLFWWCCPKGVDIEDWTDSEMWAWIREHAVNEPVNCYWEYELMQLLRQIMWTFLKSLKTELLYVWTRYSTSGYGSKNQYFNDFSIVTCLFKHYIQHPRYG